jgi:CRP-like cAMP-binding protein
MPEVSDSLLRILQRKVFQKDTVIFREGDHASYAYIILRGSVFIAKTNENNVSLLTTLVTNQMFGELALFESKPRSATAIAAEITEVLVITKEQFDSKIGKLDGFMRHLVGYLADRIFDLSARVDD